MKNPFKKEPTSVDLQIDKIMLEMNTTPVNSNKDLELVGTLERLTELKTKTGPSKLDRNVVAAVAGNVAGVAMIAFAERAMILSKNALSHLKIKV